MRFVPWLAVLLLIPAGCGEDKGKEPERSETGRPLSETLAKTAGGYTLDTGSVAMTKIDGADEALRAEYDDPKGGRVSHTLASFGSTQAARSNLDALVERKKTEGFELKEEKAAKAGGRLFVLSRSPGVQARPPDFVYAWTNKRLLAVTEGVGEAAGRLYERLPY